MTAFELKRIAWWESLSPVWKDVFIRNLDLVGHFELPDLKYLQVLDELDCSGSQIQSLEPLGQIPHLKKLILSDSYVIDYSFLPTLQQLEYLDLSFCRKLDAQYIKPLTHLQALDLSFPGDSIQHPNLISEMKGLRYLKADGCKDIPLISLAKLPRLTYLSMEFCYVEEMEIHLFETLNPVCRLNT